MGLWKTLKDGVRALQRIAEAIERSANTEWSKMALNSTLTWKIEENERLKGELALADNRINAQYAQIETLLKEIARLGLKLAEAQKELKETEACWRNAQAGHEHKNRRISSLRGHISRIKREHEDIWFLFNLWRNRAYFLQKEHLDKRDWDTIDADMAPEEG